MSPPRTLDEARAAYPDLTFFISAGAGMPVSLDVVDEADVAHSWQADTEAEVWALAFPAGPAAEPVLTPQRPPAGPAREEHDLAQALAPSREIGLFD